MDILAYVKSKGNFSTLLMGLGTVFAGTAAAAIRGNMEILPASICLIFVIFTQLSANYYHAYNGYTNYINSLPPSRLEKAKMRENPLAQRVLKEAFNACLILSLMIGITIMTMCRNPWSAFVLGVLIYGLYGLLSYGGKSLMGTPWGLFTTFLLFGPIGVIGTCLVQSQHEAGVYLWGVYDTAPPMLLGLAMGFMAMNVHLMYSYYTHKIAPGEAKYNLCSKIGPKTTIAFIFFNGLMAFAVITFKIFYLNYPQPFLADVPAFLTFALNCYIAFRMYRSNMAELRHLTMLSKMNYFLLGLVLFIVWWAIGTPDDSVMRLF